MQQLKRLVWLFAAGFATVAGAAMAIYFSVGIFEKRSEAETKHKYALDPGAYQKPQEGQFIFKDVKLSTLTIRGGVFGYIENHSRRALRSFNADLSLSKGTEVVHRCSETVTVEVAVGESATFQLLCSDLDRNLLSSDLAPSISINWVYPSHDQ
jgi:hypothetical protein